MPSIAIQHAASPTVPEIYKFRKNDFNLIIHQNTIVNLDGLNLHPGNYDVLIKYKMINMSGQGQLTIDGDTFILPAIINYPTEIFYNDNNYKFLGSVNISQQYDPEIKFTGTTTSNIIEVEELILINDFSFIAVSSDHSIDYVYTNIIVFTGTSIQINSNIDKVTTNANVQPETLHSSFDSSWDDSWD